MSSRYATLITDDDGREVISAIGQFEGAPQGRAGHFEPVAAGVRIGMVRGGPVDAAGGFGFPLAGDGAGGVSIVRAALKALPDAGAAKPGTTAGAKPDAARRKPKAKPARGKRAKSRRKPARKTAAKPAAPAEIAGQV